MLFKTAVSNGTLIAQKVLLWLQARFARRENVLVRVGELHRCSRKVAVCTLSVRLIHLEDVNSRDLQDSGELFFVVNLQCQQSVGDVRDLDKIT